MEEDPTPEVVANLLRPRLQHLQQLSGLPVVFGGSTRRNAHGQQSLVIEELSGTFGTALEGVTVPSGRGLGGATLTMRRPKLTREYANDRSISHDFDVHVVEQEQISSIFAFPIRLNGEIEGVFYGAVRDRARIGDEALRSANYVAQQLEKELAAVLGPHAGRAHPPTGPDALDHRVRVALDELTQMIRTTRDVDLRHRLERIHQQLAGTPRQRGRSTLLAPRELDALRLAAIGATNADIATQLGLSPQTVKAYMRSAMRKLEVRNRTAAVHAARAAGAI